jgi:predicted transposase/invertase (TIGR01784 family)
MANVFVNPFTDFGFKKIFGEEASKPHLMDFLNALLPSEAQIKDLSFKNLEQLPASEDRRKAVYDIYCQGTNGEYFIVELQKARQNYFKDRTIYYSTFPIQEQAKQGEWDYQLQAVYCIGILNFRFAETAKLEKHKVIHTIKLKNQQNQVFYDKLSFIYLEMPNFDKSLEELRTRLDKWLYFIKNLGDLQSIPELLKDKVFTQAFETAKLANLDSSSREQYQQSLKILRDNFSVMETAVQQAREVALAEGETKGKLEARLEIAKNAKAAGLTIRQIEAITGLSPEELEQHGI